MSPWWLRGAHLIHIFRAFNPISVVEYCHCVPLSPGCILCSVFHVCCRKTTKDGTRLAFTICDVAYFVCCVDLSGDREIEREIGGFTESDNGNSGNVREIHSGSTCLMKAGFL